MSIAKKTKVSIAKKTKDKLFAQAKADLEAARLSLESALDAFERIQPKRETNVRDVYNMIEFRAYCAVCHALEKLSEPYK